MNLAEIDLLTYQLLNLYAESSSVIESTYQHFRKLGGVEIAPIAGHPDSGYKNIDGNQTVASWLANDANISTDRAIEIVIGFPMPVAQRLNQIAMNPCRFLGLASSITRSPEAIVFSTAGMDPLGCENIHKCATNQFAGTLIHVDVRPCEYCRIHGTSYELIRDLTVVVG